MCVVQLMCVGMSCVCHQSIVNYKIINFINLKL